MSFIVTTKILLCIWIKGHILTCFFMLCYACLSVYDTNTMPTWSVSCTGMTRAPSIATAICLGCAQTKTVSTCIIKPTRNQKWRNEVITVELLKFVVAQFSWISYVPLIHKFTSSMIYETQYLNVSILKVLYKYKPLYKIMLPWFC